MAKNFLIIRFRQLGDTVLTTPLLDTLKRNFNDCHIDIVLNDRLAPLFYHHPSVDRVITFTEKERHNAIVYTEKVWRITHATHYDAIIDLRSTVNTMLFSLFSLHSRIRCGVAKSYSGMLLSDRVDACRPDETMIDHNLRLLKPLESIKRITYSRNLSLVVTPQEHTQFAHYMQQRGIDLDKPIMLAGVTAKLEHKAWNRWRMAATLRLIATTFPQLQIILNYAPGHEEQEAREIAEAVGCNNVFFGIEARGIRQLMAMTACCTFYFGNEGGTRHIADAMGKPTFSICSPDVAPHTWIPADTRQHMAVSPRDFKSASQLASMSYTQRYNLISTEAVWSRLKPFIAKHAS